MGGRSDAPRSPAVLVVHRRRRRTREAADMGCVYWRGEERDDQLEQQRAFYERVIAEDSHEAEPALRLLADEGQELLLPLGIRPAGALLIANI